MPEADILYAVEHAVATITFNRPERRNAFGDATRDELLGLLREAAADEHVGCIVITGQGKAFAAGGDIHSMRAQQVNDDASVIDARIAVANEVVRCIRALAKPVIAAVNGAAAGGGMNLALACDIRYAAEAAVFSESFVKIGLIPDWGGHYLLTRIVGTSQALELMMLGERIDAATALRLGIVNAVFPDASFRADVAARARALAAGPREALAAIKRGVLGSETGTLEDALAFERAEQVKLFLSDDAREGMRAFIDKRAPVFGDD